MHHRSPRDRRTGTGRRWWRLGVAAFVAIVLAGCGVLELGGGGHSAVVVEAAENVEEERWTVLTELLSTEISGATVISLSFDQEELRCTDGQAADPTILELGTEFTFEQSGDVEHSEPPAVHGLGLEVDCD